MADEREPGQVDPIEANDAPEAPAEQSPPPEGLPQAVPPPTAPPPPPLGFVPVSTAIRTAEERKALLAQTIQNAVVQGRRVESQSEFQAVLVYGKPVNHVLHAILTIFTCLLWGIVWIIMAAQGGEKRELMVVDEFGNVRWQGLG